MGGTSTKESLLYFMDVARGVSPPDEKDFSSHLGRCRKELCSGAELYRTLLPIMQTLMPANAQASQVQWVVRFCLKQVEHASCNYSQGVSDIFLTTVRAVQFVVRHACETSRGDASRLLWTIGEDLGESVHGALRVSTTGDSDTVFMNRWLSTGIGKLCIALEKFIVFVPLTVSTVEAHGEVVSLLLCMCSTALYHSTACDTNFTDPFTRLILASGDLHALVLVLLQRLMDWGEGRLPKTPVLYRCAQYSSLWTLYNMFAGGTENESITCGNHLGRHCAQLLSVLVSYGKGYRPNEALHYIASLGDSSQIQVKALLVTFNRHVLRCPALCILLYTLLHDNPTFIHTVMTAYPDEFLGVIQGVLRLSYTASSEAWASGFNSSDDDIDGGQCAIPIVEDAITPEAVASIVRRMTAFSYPFISFMTGTLVLVCSQDQVINKRMSNTIAETTFKVGRLVGRCPVIAVCIVIIVHSIARALNDGNEALAAVFIPCLANFAPFVHDIDVYTSQRLVGLLLLTLRKVQRTAEHARSGAGDCLGTLEGTTPAGGCSSADTSIQMFLRQLLALTEAVGGLLQGDCRNNYSFIYELVYQRSHLEEGAKLLSTVSCHSSEAQTALQSLLSVAKFYDEEIANSTATDSYGGALAVIRQVSQNKVVPTGPSSRLSVRTGTYAATASADVEYCTSLEMGEIPFLYEESTCSYDFFGPFLWSTLLSDAAYPGGILWATDLSTLGIFPH
ncbi:hypothetical protein, conserved [Trypanosoma brucei brucei TREU927]|uniref:Dymeclin n=1 Tax=Trypanosoma brucei brucei (strain 927/4 GUTat10.1) TaxID=185431 RepID=Q38FE7_TRYB2|nr:hypothetical protein, conserved [Trypanosoma brucei brucei TREU927]EAN76473.1 hypothetical protein, conserved [Trypanosoma brucei brucei TREU927]